MIIFIYSSFVLIKKSRGKIEINRNKIIEIMVYFKKINTSKHESFRFFRASNRKIKTFFA